MAQGRVTTYVQEVHDKVVYAMTSAGYAVDEITTNLGISRQTYWRWRRENPTFMAASKMGADIAIERAEATLYEAAVSGFTTRTVKTVTTNDGKETVTVEDKEHPPNVFALIKYLMAKKPDEWSSSVEPHQKDEKDLINDVNIKVITSTIKKKIDENSKGTDGN